MKQEGAEPLSSMEELKPTSEALNFPKKFQNYGN